MSIRCRRLLDTPAHWLRRKAFCLQVGLTLFYHDSSKNYLWNDEHYTMENDTFDGREPIPRHTTMGNAVALLTFSFQAEEQPAHHRYWYEEPGAKRREIPTDGIEWFSSHNRSPENGSRYRPETSDRKHSAGKERRRGGSEAGRQCWIP